MAPGGNMVMGEVAQVGPDMQFFSVKQPDGMYSALQLAPASRVIHASGQMATPCDLKPGQQVRASYRVGDRGQWIADQVTIVSPAAEGRGGAAMAAPSENVISGEVSDITPSMQFFSIRQPDGTHSSLQWSDATQVKHSDGSMASASEIKPGHQVQAKYRTSGEGTLIADEIIILTPVEAGRGGPGMEAAPSAMAAPQENMVTGEIAEVSPGMNYFQVRQANDQFTAIDLNPDTQVTDAEGASMHLSDLREGQRVKTTYRTGDRGQMVADQVELLEPAPKAAQHGIHAVPWWSRGGPSQDMPPSAPEKYGARAFFPRS
jgi:cold shock CspA family protein